MCAQEFFLIDRDMYLRRPDLVACGRSLIGAQPPKGQSLSDQYFADLSDRFLACVQDVEVELWKLGIPHTTRHREVRRWGRCRGGCSSGCDAWRGFSRLNVAHARNRATSAPSCCRTCPCPSLAFVWSTLYLCIVRISAVASGCATAPGAWLAPTG